MKKSLYTFITFCTILGISCSEESPIEGLTTGKSSVAAINTEIAAGSNKTIALTVNGQTFNLQIENSTSTSNGFETKDCVISAVNDAVVFPLASSSAYLNTADAGTEISAAAFSTPSYRGTLFFVTRPLNSSTYNYVNTNGIRFDNSYYIPFKVVPGNGQRAPVYAYLQFTITAEKLILHKMAYRTIGTLAAGG